MSMLHSHHDVTETPAGSSEVRTTHSRIAMSPGQMFGGAVGVISTIIGMIAVIRSGIDGSLNVPVVHVVGLNQSAMVGIGEVVLGLLLVAGAASAWDRALMGFVGAVMFIGGIVVAAASIKFLGDLGTDHATGWTMIVGGVIAMAAAMMPTFVARFRSARAPLIPAI